MTAALAIPASRADDDVALLVRTHLPLVGYLVRELAARLPAHIARDELVSAGHYALVLAARSFDAERGVPFARFAAIRIRGALTDELRSMDWASRSVRGKARELYAVREHLTARFGREATRTEVATTLGIAPREVESIDADVRRASVLSLHTLAPDAADELLPVDGDGPEAVLLKREQLGYLHDAVDELPERMRTVVRMYFFQQHTMLHIAEHLGVTESRVSQLRAEALTLLRAGLHAAQTGEPTPPANKRAAEYCAAVTARSSLSGRLAATTVLGEPRRELHLV
jgi:RNA polymerase sigma factor FliA